MSNHTSGPTDHNGRFSGAEHPDRGDALPPAATPAEPPDPVDPNGRLWLRLDKRMLLVHPVNEVVKFIPVLIGTLILGTSSGNHWWSIISLALIIGIALARWFTTAYRIGPAHVELRTGLLQRRTLSVPRSRIRSVDIEADLLHRALGLAVVVIGTGQQAETSEKFKLDSLDAGMVPALRNTLLAHATAGTQGVAGQPIPPSAQVGPPTPESGFRAPAALEIGHWQPRWVRYAPLSLTGFAVVAPIVAAAFQYGLGEVVFSSDAAHNIEEGTAALVVISMLILVAAIVVLVSLAACTRYLTTYFGLRVLDDGHTLHLRHGLFTTRQITLDLARFRGATVNEPLLLRLAGGAELEAIMVGENARQKLLPQAPRAAVERTLAELLVSRAAAPTPETAATPQRDPAAYSRNGATPATSVQITVALTPHGPAARRRRYTRAVTPALIPGSVMLLYLLADVTFSPWWWLLPAVVALIGVALAEDRYRGLGHAVLPATADTPAWLITRAGSLDRDRDCLEARGIIGWTVRQTFWQRRSGVATVVAATAAGKKRYLVTDIPVDEAWALIEEVTPGQLGTQ
ncbi:PH domain-containing protein [Nocardia sp. NPDC050710]|uniref:PH domain-containing protein n=1 Tax=Nocardia sp. NPDC050710 TaxID=3157220 RepID=UPI0033F369CD